MNGALQPRDRLYRGAVCGAGQPDLQGLCLALADWGPANSGSSNGREPEIAAFTPHVAQRALRGAAPWPCPSRAGRLTATSARSPPRPEPGGRGTREASRYALMR